jgi:hypothetical protein
VRINVGESSELKIIITADDKASSVLQNNKKQLLDLGSIAGGALKVGLATATTGMVALGAGLFTSAQAAAAAEDVQADLAATLLSTKGVSGMTLDSLNALASGFQNTTKFEDDTILKGQSMLLTFTNIGKDVFPATTEAMLNMGQKFGSVDAAALQLGKALNDPIAGVGALRRVGVTLTEQQEEQIKQYMALGKIEEAQKIILGELQKEFGGVATAAGTTATGKLEIFRNKMGDVSERIGGAMLPGLSKLGDGFIKALDNPIVIKAIDAITNWLAEALPKAIDTGAGLLNTLSTKGIGGVLANIQLWVNDPATQKALQTAGAAVGQGAFAGIKAALSSGPMWAALASDIGKVILPMAAEMGMNFWIGMIGGMMGKSPEEISKGVGFRIPGLGGIGLGGAKVPGFAAGGVVGGPWGAPQLVVAHGGETIAPAGAGSGGFTFVYAPMISLADEREAQAKLAPVLDRWWSSAKRTRTT